MATDTKKHRYKLAKVVDLIPYANNSRTHSSEQINQIAGSIKEFGFTNPVLIDSDGGIIAGHGRVMAAKKLGISEVPCIEIVGLTNAQKKAYIIADNQLPLNAGWDLDVLKLEIESLDEDDFNIELLGFDAEFVSGLIGDEHQETGDENSIPETPTDPITVIGDVWECGNSRVMCGDSTSQTDIEKLLNGNNWDVCVFDPPYEVESLYDDAIPPFEPGKKLCVFWDFKRFAIAGHSASNAGWSGLFEFIWDNCTSWYTPNRPLARHKACGVFGDNPHFNFDEAIIQDGKKREAKVVSNSRGKCNYKPLDGAVHIRTVESFPTTQESGGHAHSKPVKWVEAIFNGIGGVRYLDLFGGSGSTLIACQKTGRDSYTMELDPENVDVIVKRWADYTGLDPINTRTGKKLSESSCKAECCDL